MKRNLHKIFNPLFLISNSRLSRYLVHSTKRSTRIILLICIDILIVTCSFFASFFLAYKGEIFLTLNESIFYIPLSVFIAILIYIFTGQYNGLTRYLTSSSIYYIACRNILLTYLIRLFSSLIRFPQFDFYFWIIFLSFITLATTSSRVLLRDLILLINNSNYNAKKKVIIYGAGEFGAQLYASLRLNYEYNIIAFIDSDQSLRGRSISSVPIFPPSYLDKIDLKSIDLILLAIPSLSNSKKRFILNSLKKYDLPVLQVPPITELSRGNANIDSFIPVSIEDLLGRDIVSADYNLLRDSIEGKIVFVSGAGGSIGSELCRQIIINKPNKLLVFDQCEPSLYNLYNNLLQLIDSNIILVPLLGNATNFSFLKQTFIKYKVDIVFHAAAYKHVPLVELNPLSGIYNNVFSTKSICQAVLESRVKNAVLISSDKAVRPSNVMGASKRLCELIFQSFAEYMLENKTDFSKFSIVRFGNVLNSSGSVLPLFRKQIKNGGPLTITHPEITRFFMTIPEAAQLVIQSSALATGGEVYLLDMGEPVKIKDLALDLIQLSGLTIKDENQPDGDIEIIYSGLRPGEKLYEELLIGSESIPTLHPLIFQSNEPYVSYSELWPLLKELELSVNELDQKKTLELLLKFIPEASFESFYKADDNLIQI